MAKVRVPINPIMRGGVGSYTFYERNSEQVVRQRKNNSNYGENAKRSYAQQIRRVKWANLVNFWKVAGPYLKDAFETKSKGQTDYNKFMQYNVPSAKINLLKQEAENDAVVADNFTVSMGSFSHITTNILFTGGAVSVETNLVRKITSIASATWGQVSKDIIDNNPEWKDGDNLAMLVLHKYTDALNGFPHLRAKYYEQTIDSASTDPVSNGAIGDLLNSAGSAGEVGVYGAVCPGLTEATCGGAVMFHARRSGSLKVSTEQFIGADTNLENYTSEKSLQAAIDSYGLSDVVELYPN